MTRSAQDMGEPMNEFSVIPYKDVIFPGFFDL